MKAELMRSRQNAETLRHRERYRGQCPHAKVKIIALNCIWESLWACSVPSESGAGFSFWTFCWFYCTFLHVWATALATVLWVIVLYFVLHCSIVLFVMNSFNNFFNTSTTFYSLLSPISHSHNGISHKGIFTAMSCDIWQNLWILKTNVFFLHLPFGKSTKRKTSQKVKLHFNKKTIPATLQSWKCFTFVKLKHFPTSRQIWQYFGDFQTFLCKTNSAKPIIYSPQRNVKIR